MGKLKNHKNSVKNNIFKVAGCKSLKVKNKAKTVTADRLKQLSLKNKQKIEDIDDRLTNLSNEVRRPVKETVKNTDISVNIQNSIIERQEKIRKYQETEENSVLALDKLSSMEM